MKYDFLHLVFIFIGPQILEWISCNEMLALIIFPNDFLFVLPAKLYSLVRRLMSEVRPNNQSRIDLSIIFCSICRNRISYVDTSILSYVLKHPISI